MRIASSVALALLLAACASTDPNYTSYADATLQLQQRELLARTSISEAATNCNGDATCVVAVAGFAAMAVNGGTGRAAALQPYQRQFHPAWQILGAVLPQVVSSAAAVYQNRYAGETARRQWDVLGEALSATRISVGGDYVSGTQHLGDVVGGDQIGGNQTIAGGDMIGGDAIGGDRVEVGGDQHIGDAIDGDRIDVDGNDNRIHSPGPFDNDGGDCTAGSGAVGGDGGNGGDTDSPGGPGAPGGTGGDCTGGPGG